MMQLKPFYSVLITNWFKHSSVFKSVEDGKCQFRNVSHGSFIILLFLSERASLSTVSPHWTFRLWLITEAPTALKSKHRPQHQNLSLRCKTFNLSSRFITAITFIFTFTMTAFFPCRCIQQMTFIGGIPWRASKRVLAVFKPWTGLLLYWNDLGLNWNVLSPSV